MVGGDEPLQIKNNGYYFYVGANRGGGDYVDIGGVHPTEGYANIIINRDGGNIGIGTINPAHKLDVAGNIHSSGTIYSNSGSFDGSVNVIGIVGIGPNPPNESQLNVVGTSPQLTIRDSVAGVNQKIGVNNNGLSIHFDGGPALIVTRSWGNVGIGTTSPEKKLHVNGNLKADSYYGDGSNLTGISGTTDNDWTIAGDNVYHEIGKVGIGNSNPGRSLDVSGRGKFETSSSSEILKVVNNGSGHGVYVDAYTSANYTAAIEGVAHSSSGKTYGLKAITKSSTDEASAVYAEAEKTSSGNTKGVIGITNAISNSFGSACGVWGIAANTTSAGGGNLGVFGETRATVTNGGYHSVGVYGQASAQSTDAHVSGVFGETWSTSAGCAGVWGENNATSGSTRGVCGISHSSDGTGIFAFNDGGGYGVRCQGKAKFEGDMEVTGNLSKGSGSFKIDHPLDPENKYLYHSFVESPDMMNVYNGNIILDEDGEAVVELPEWFEALNKDFRYQLTCIGGFEPVYIEEEIFDNRFTIAGGTKELKVSWQVTGIRKDPYAQKYRIPVEVEKDNLERGSYLYPEAYKTDKVRLCEERTTI